MYPAVHAAQNPDKPAVVVAGGGEVLTYRQLDERSLRLANALHERGLRPGDVVGLLSDNSPRVFEVYWACLRSGLYLTAVNNHLTPAEAAYILDDCGATALVGSAGIRELLEKTAADVPAVPVRLVFGGTAASFEDYEEALAAASPVAPSDQPRGADMLYSSGTTGRPKGVKPPLPARQVGEPGDPYVAVFGGSYGFDSSSVYFSPAPLYHAAPLRFGMVVTSLGGTIVIATGFDPEACLAALQKHKVTHSQWVPTHFVRLLRLPEETRAKYDTSAQKVVIHAAAPCPVEVKGQMLDWWGPILFEYYGSTEGNGVTMVDPQEWLAKPGSVGKAKLGVIHVCDDEGNEVPTGAVGQVFFERELMPFAYHKDPVKTAAAQHPLHLTWSTTGDIGKVDEDGYLYLTDRKAFTIISGGVNIYPQEIEDCLVLHPDVFDVAVVGVPHPDFGESVLAVVQTNPGVAHTTEVADGLLEHLRSRIAGYKVPKRLEFTDVLPRTPTGKLLKGVVRDQYSAT